MGRTAIKLARLAGPPYGRRASPHWFDADHLAETLSIIEPPDTTVRQFLERLDGCTGATAGRIAAAFGKGRVCRDLTKSEASKLLTAVQGAAREIKPIALGPVGISGFDPSEFDGYARRTGSFRHGSHEPQANIPFIVEVWAYVADRKGHQVELTVLANRTPVVTTSLDGDSTRVMGSCYLVYARDGIVLSGGGLWDSKIDVKAGDCSIVLHVTSPLIPILSIGKRPNLSVFQPEISEAIRLAFNQSRGRLPPDPAQPKPSPAPKVDVDKVEKPSDTFAPRSPLGQRIEGTAKASGMSVDELTVLSTGLDPYRFDNVASHRNGAWFAEQVARLVRVDAAVHLRGLFYRIVASATVLRPDNGQAFINTETNWRWLKEDASKAAR